MSDYLPQIEEEYSIGRGKPSRLSPLDWTLAQAWETKGVPVWLARRAMGDVVKNFKSKKPGQIINSLSYFKQEVEKQFNEWLQSQVGKSIEISTTEENTMDNVYVQESASIEIDTLEALAEQFNKKDLPEPLQSAAVAVRRDLILLIEDASQKHLSMDAIEDRLKEIKLGLVLPMIISVPEAERETIIEKINKDFSGRTLDDDSRAMILTRRLYERFGLPSLTLFEL